MVLYLKQEREGAGLVVGLVLLPVVVRMVPVLVLVVRVLVVLVAVYQVIITPFPRAIRHIRTLEAWQWAIGHFTLAEEEEGTAQD